MGDIVSFFKVLLVISIISSGVFSIDRAAIWLGGVAGRFLQGEQPRALPANPAVPIQPLVPRG